MQAPSEGNYKILGVPIGTRSRVLPYITHTWGPLHFVWSGPVRDVAPFMQPNGEVFLKMFFDSLIKLNELYETVEKHFEVQ